MRTLAIVGAGHVGRTLGRLWQVAGVFDIAGVLARSPASAQRGVDFIGAGVPVAQPADLPAADIYLLAVTDDQIVPACAALAATRSLQGAIVFHCSGALASGTLEAARQGGALLASVHPVRSFADPAAVVAAFAGTFCGTEGDAAALAVLVPALEAIGARPVAIDPAAKTVYHAAAVFASNYLVTVLDAALRAYQAAGIPADVARELAQPLAQESLSNVFRMGAAEALSGPIARGDYATVQRQQAAVSAWDADSGTLYGALVPPTAALAARKRR